MYVYSCQPHRRRQGGRGGTGGGGTRLRGGALVGLGQHVVQARAEQGRAQQGQAVDNLVGALAAAGALWGAAGKGGTVGNREPDAVAEPGKGGGARPTPPTPNKQARGLVAQKARGKGGGRSHTHTLAKVGFSAPWPTPPAVNTAWPALMLLGLLITLAGTTLRWWEGRGGDRGGAEGESGSDVAKLATRHAGKGTGGSQTPPHAPPHTLVSGAHTTRGAAGEGEEGKGGRRQGRTHRPPKTIARPASLPPMRPCLPPFPLSRLHPSPHSTQ